MQPRRLIHDSDATNGPASSYERIIDDARTDGPPTILVAEDEPDIRLMMKMLLEMRGYRVVEGRDGQEAADVAKDLRPDLIIIDLQLPRLNGIAVARFLRQTDSTRHIPIVVVSAHDPFKHRALALAAGCNAYIQKPIDFDQLDETLASLLTATKSSLDR